MTQQARATWLRQYGLLLPYRPESEVDDPVHIEQRAVVHARVRVHLELMVRAAAVASLDEAEFISRIRATGTELWAGSGAAPVTRYALAQDGRLYRDIDLGTDLMLPVLRGDWDTGYAARVNAATAWQAPQISSLFDRGRVRLSHPVIWARMITAAGQSSTALRAIPSEQAGLWAYAATRTAGMLAQWSYRAQPAMSERLASAALDVARSAHTTPPQGAGDRIGACSNRVAFGLAQLDRAVIDRPREQRLLLVQMMDAVALIARAHRDRREVQRWRSLEAAVESLSTVCEDLRTQAQRQGWSL